jgi:hypothetical protein
VEGQGAKDCTVGLSDRRSLSGCRLTERMSMLEHALDLEDN